MWYFPTVKDMDLESCNCVYYTFRICQTTDVVYLRIRHFWGEL